MTYCTHNINQDPIDDMITARDSHGTTVYKGKCCVCFLDLCVLIFEPTHMCKQWSYSFNERKPRWQEYSFVRCSCRDAMRCWWIQNWDSESGDPTTVETSHFPSVEISGVLGRVCQISNTYNAKLHQIYKWSRIMRRKKWKELPAMTLPRGALGKHTLDLALTPALALALVPYFALMFTFIHCSHFHPFQAWPRSIPPVNTHFCSSILSLVSKHRNLPFFLGLC